MITIKGLIAILLTATFINNYVLQQFLGICPFLGVSKKLDQATGMSIAVIFVMMIATLVTWPIQTFLLTPNGLGYMQTIVFILVIAALVQLTNCAVLGVCINNIDSEFTFAQAMFNAFGSGLGFLIAMLMFAGIRQHIEDCDPPESFKGLPITLISAGIVSISFFGFAGIVDNLFG